MPLDILVLLLLKGHIDSSEEADVIQVVFGLGRPEIKKKAPNININIEPVARHKAKSELLTLKRRGSG